MHHGWIGNRNLNDINENCGKVLFDYKFFVYVWTFESSCDIVVLPNKGGSIMILEALKSLYPNASEKVLIAVKEDLEKLRGKQVSTVELVEWMDKLVVAHTINEALKIEDDSKPTSVGNESSFVYVEGSDEIND